VAKIRLKIFAFLAGYLGSLNLQFVSVKRLAGLHFSRNRQRLQRAGRGTAQEDQTNAIGQGRQPVEGDYLRTKEAFPVHSGRHTLFLEDSGGSPHMTQRASESLVAVLIRIGLLLALVIMLMAENAQAQPLPHLRHGQPTSLQPRLHAVGTQTNRS
jgi:hypothetical protein